MVKDMKEVIKKIEQEMMEDIDLMEELTDEDGSGSGYNQDGGGSGGDGDSDECNVENKKRKTWQTANPQKIIISKECCP